MNECYDKIPIPYSGQLEFFDPITGPTYPHATAQNCCDRSKKLCQFHMDLEDSWCILTPGMVHKDQPATFGLHDINAIASHSFTGSQDEGIHTRNKLRGFWESILKNATSRTALKKCSQNPIVYTTAGEGIDGFHYFTPRTEFFVDGMISPGCFKDRFLAHSELSFTYLGIAEIICQSFYSSRLSLTW